MSEDWVRSLIDCVLLHPGLCDWSRLCTNHIVKSVWSVGPAGITSPCGLSKLQKMRHDDAALCDIAITHDAHYSLSLIDRHTGRIGAKWDEVGVLSNDQPSRQRPDGFASNTARSWTALLQFPGKIVHWPLNACHQAWPIPQQVENQTWCHNSHHVEPWVITLIIEIMRYDD